MFFLSWCRTARQKVYFPKIIFHLLSAEDRSLGTGRVAGNGFPYLTFDSPVSATQPSARITHPWEVVCFSLLIIWENISSILLIMPYNHQERLYFFFLSKTKSEGLTEMDLGWLNTCLTYMKPWISFPVLQNAKEDQRIPHIPFSSSFFFLLFYLFLVCVRAPQRLQEISMYMLMWHLSRF